MAKSKAAKPSIPTSRRPYNALFISAFIALATIFGVLMRVDTAINGVPIDLPEIVEAGHFPNGVPIVKRYTGIEAIDTVAQFFVAVFLAGPLGWDPGAQAQQRHFLLNWFAVVCVWSAEAYRGRNKGRIITFLTPLAILYQTVGACVIAPLYYAFYLYSSSQDAYHFQGREVSPAYAKVLLPAAVLGYLVPSIALWYTPWSNNNAAQYLAAFWQISPLIAGALIPIFSFFVPSSSTKAKNSDVKHLRVLYIVTALICAAEHIHTLYSCFTSDDPRVSFSYVFLPDRATMKDSMTLGLHYIMQLDFWGVFISALFWCWIVLYDSMRILGGYTTSHLIQNFLGLVFHALVIGPGATLALVYHWREERLVMIESGVKGSWKKPKAA
ncbi:uncharacterized protein F4822DRAFT_400267 [Hypoxylon trugodes]|uniref:uncharacterized protein n=1 Tax=Hypoxylon trugodes TaxID=326681 RepID=UPI00218E07BC|nr:uncharacterized protein F4822DRAFT_400267 [Hypoxylon trugodes]KAI1389929.1 hypothetical protein F4822DRAFT_400267 [Hypoxylon trugodes]